jgi:hypothetical protein
MAGRCIISVGERLYTRYIALPPEYGKEQFFEAFDRETSVLHKRLTCDKFRYNAGNNA